MWDQKGGLHTYPRVHTKGMKRKKIKIGEEGRTNERKLKSQKIMKLLAKGAFNYLCLQYAFTFTVEIRI